MHKKILITLSFAIVAPFVTYADNDISSSSLEKTNKVNQEEKVSPASLFTECSQNAIETRDTKLSASRASYNTVMTQALNERKNREKLAIAISGEQSKKNAIKTSVETYKNQAKAAQNNLIQARKEAWQAFEDDIKKCHELYDSGDTKHSNDAQETLDVYSKKDDTKSIKETILDSIKSFFN